MCRWLVYRGDRVLLSDVVLRPRNSLFALSREFSRRALPHLEKSCYYDETEVALRNNLVNADGFGVAWYDCDDSNDDTPVLFKACTPAWSNRNFIELAKVTHSTTILAHVRAASPGLPVSESNCHPFRMGRFTFMHNGAVAGFNKIRRPIQQSLRDDVFNHCLQGNTDSEHLFALYMNQLSDPDGYYTAQQLAQVMENTIMILLQLQREAGITGYSSLNMCVTDGHSFVATRARNDPDGDPPSLYYAAGSQFRLDGEELTDDLLADEDGKHEVFLDQSDTEPLTSFICSSEPLSLDHAEQWKLLPKDSMLVVSGDKPCLRIEVLPLNLYQEWSDWLEGGGSRAVLGPHSCDVPGCVLSLWASGELVGKVRLPSTATTAAETTTTTTTTNANTMTITTAPTGTDANGKTTALTTVPAAATESKSALFTDCPLLTTLMDAITCSSSSTATKSECKKPAATWPCNRTGRRKSKSGTCGSNDLALAGMPATSPPMFFSNSDSSHHGSMTTISKNATIGNTTAAGTSKPKPSSGANIKRRSGGSSSGGHTGPSAIGESVGMGSPSLRRSGPRQPGSVVVPKVPFFAKLLCDAKAALGVPCSINATSTTMTNTAPSTCASSSFVGGTPPPSTTSLMSPMLLPSSAPSSISYVNAAATPSASTTTTTTNSLSVSSSAAGTTTISAATTTVKTTTSPPLSPSLSAARVAASSQSIAVPASITSPHGSPRLLANHSNHTNGNGAIPASMPSLILASCSSSATNSPANVTRRLAVTTSSNGTSTPPLQLSVLAPSSPPLSANTSRTTSSSSPRAKGPTNGNGLPQFMPMASPRDVVPVTPGGSPQIPLNRAALVRAQSTPGSNGNQPAAIPTITAQPQSTITRRLSDCTSYSQSVPRLASLTMDTSPTSSARGSPVAAAAAIAATRNLLQHSSRMVTASSTTTATSEPAATKADIATMLERMSALEKHLTLVASLQQQQLQQQQTNMANISTLMVQQNKLTALTNECSSSSSSSSSRRPPCRCIIM